MCLEGAKRRGLAGRGPRLGICGPMAIAEDWRARGRRACARALCASILLAMSWGSWESCRSWPARRKMKSYSGGPPTSSGTPTPSTPTLQKKISLPPLRGVRGFDILEASADGPGSRKERDDLVLLGG